MNIKAKIGCNPVRNATKPIGTATRILLPPPKAATASQHIKPPDPPNGGGNGNAGVERWMGLEDGDYGPPDIPPSILQGEADAVGRLTRKIIREKSLGETPQKKNYGVLVRKPVPLDHRLPAPEKKKSLLGKILGKWFK